MDNPKKGEIWVSFWNNPWSEKTFRIREVKNGWVRYHFNALPFRIIRTMDFFETIAEFTKYHKRKEDQNEKNSSS